VIEHERHRAAGEAWLELDPVGGFRDVDLDVPAERRDSGGDVLEHRGRRAGRELVHQARGAETAGGEAL
jgi:hypothetical protein